MTRCAAYKCQTTFSRGCGKSVHRFPKDPVMRRKWVMELRRQKFSPSAYSCLCSDHFTADCFDRTGQTVRLRADAVPTVFNFPPHLQKEQMHRKAPVLRETMSTQCSSESVPQGPFLAPKTNEHDYCLGSPKTLNAKLLRAVETIKAYKKKCRQSQQKNRRSQKKISTLQNIIQSLRGSQLLTENGAFMLENCSEVPLEILKRRKGGYSKYNPALKSFALTLQFYSSKAYNYVRETFDLGLPHPSTIRRWYSSNGGDPGFSEEVLASLQLKASAAQAKGQEILCALMIDEMSIMKHIEWDGKRMLGYVDVGTKIENEGLPMATEVLVIMAVCIHDHWKAPVAYFLTHGMTGSERASIVRQCILKLSDAGVRVVSLTCDGPSTHFCMLKDLGAHLHPTNLNPSFPDPSDSQRRVHVILDVCHMLKLVRNTLGSCGIIVDPCGNNIKWEYIKSLHSLQRNEGLHLGNKLRSAHIDWQSQKMKVNLAAQTLSASVADALRFCERHLQLPQFAGCEPTCKFLEIFDRLFDLMNSRNPIARGFKSPLRKSTEMTNKTFLMEAYNYISGLKEPGVNGRPLVTTGRKTAFLGFLVAIKSFIHIYDTYVAPPTSQLQYLLTYKFSQDHLELFFAAIRSANGFNNNPTARQFKSAFKRMVARTAIKSCGNCSPLDSTSVLEATPSDILKFRRSDIQPDTEEHTETDILSLPGLPNLSLFKEAVIGYIAGFIIRTAMKKIHCHTCLSALSVEGSSEGEIGHTLIDMKSRGGLIKPSDSVLQVCKTAERCIQQHLMTRHMSDLDSKFKARLSTQVLELHGSTAFKELEAHMFNLEPYNNHIFLLIKYIAESYTNIRLHFLAKETSAASHRKRLRKSLGKLVLHKNQ